MWPNPVWPNAEPFWKGRRSKFLRPVKNEEALRRIFRRRASRWREKTPVLPAETPGEGLPLQAAGAEGCRRRRFDDRKLPVGQSRSPVGKQREQNSEHPVTFDGNRTCPRRRPDRRIWFGGYDSAAEGDILAVIPCEGVEPVLRLKVGPKTVYNIKIGVNRLHRQEPRQAAHPPQRTTRSIREMP